MADSVVVTGQYNLVDAAGATVIPFNLTTLLGTTTNVLEHNKIKRKLIVGDGIVILDLGGVSTVRGFALFVTAGTGTVLLKHDSNTNGMTIEKGMILFGTFAVVTIETTATAELTIEYFFFE